MTDEVQNFDVVVIGSGVAGITAALCAAQAGYRVVVLERGDALPVRPGETLHPGIGPVFETLGVLDEMERVALSRPLGLIHREGAKATREPYGEDDDGSWRGYHINRADLQTVLVERACQLGAQFAFNCAAADLTRPSADALLIATPELAFACRWLVDATGMAGWSNRKTKTSYRSASAQFSVCYGYHPTSPSDPSCEWPVFTQTGQGWSFKAALGNGTTAWLQTVEDNAQGKELVKSGAKAQDGTWKVSCYPARDRVFRVGDCAARLDPSSGKGVMRAIMSAMMAVHLIHARDQAKLSDNEAETMYSEWLENWFNSDVSALNTLRAAWHYGAAEIVPSLDIPAL